MTNIPRRKIYEKMLEYEEYVMEIQILARDKKTFERLKDKYPDSFKNVEEKYRDIKALLVMFFENRTFEKEEDFIGALDYFLNNEKEVNDYLNKRKSLNNSFKNLIKDLDSIFEKEQRLDSYELTKKVFDKLDMFNDNIPRILQIRRENIK